MKPPRVPEDDIREAFHGAFLSGLERAVHCGFIFGSLAKGYYRHHHDVDIFLVFREQNDAALALALAKQRYFFFHAAIGAQPDADYPGEFYTLQEMEGLLAAPLLPSASWRDYDEGMLDRLFVLEVLAGAKTAIFGDAGYLSGLEAQERALLRDWRAAFNAEMLGMSDYDVLKHIVFGRAAMPTKS